MNNKVKFIITYSLLVLLVSGCSIRFGSDEKKTVDSNVDGGVFISSDKGNTWRQMSLIPTVKGAPQNINTLSSNDLAMDPSDSKAVYLGTVSQGLYYTYSITKGWQKSEALSIPEVKSIAVDPKNKCIIYAAGDNKVFKSKDCSRTWVQIYYDNDPAVSINTIAIDHYNTDIVHIGTSRGDVLRSSDQGDSWQPIFRGKDAIMKVAMSPFNSQVIFVATEDRGTARSLDGGLTWTDMEENLEEFKNSKRFRDIAIASDKEGLVYLATTYGLLESADYGDTWRRVDLLTPEKESTINSLTLGSDSKEIYYVTDTTFYRSVDGGNNWTTINLPSTRSGQDIVVNPDNPDIIYLCVKQEKKRGAF